MSAPDRYLKGSAPQPPESGHKSPLVFHFGPPGSFRICAFRFFPDIQFFIPAHDSPAHPLIFMTRSRPDPVYCLDLMIISSQRSSAVTAACSRISCLVPLEVAFLHNHFIPSCAAGNVYESTGFSSVPPSGPASPLQQHRHPHQPREHRRVPSPLPVCSLTAPYF